MLRFHRRGSGYLVFGGVELLLAYGAASWAIDSGNLLLYLATLMLLAGGLSNLLRLLFSLIHGHTPIRETE